MAATMRNVEEIRGRVILGEFGVKNVSRSPPLFPFITSPPVATSGATVAPWNSRMGPAARVRRAGRSPPAAVTLPPSRVRWVSE